MGKVQDGFPMINKKETAERLKCFMKWNHLTPRDIQEYLGLTCVQTVYRWLEGVNIPSVDNLYALSLLFHVSVDDLLAGNRKIVRTSDCYKQILRFITYYMKIEEAA